MSSETTQELRPTATQTSPAPSREAPTSGGAVQRKRSLAGLDFAAQERALAPEAPVQRRATAPGSVVQREDDDGKEDEVNPGVTTPEASATPTPTPAAPTEFAEWADCYAAMSVPAKTGYDQFTTLFGEARAQQVTQGGAKSADKSKFVVSRATTLWAGKVMTQQQFDAKVAEKNVADAKSVDALLVKVKKVCDETDGTNRPGSVGDGTSEWALYWEAEHGEPFRSPAGHGYKLRDYCKVIKEGVAEIKAKKGAIRDAGKLAEIAALETRAIDRYEKMKAALVVWNGRVAAYPDKWNANGTSAVAPPGVDPLARNQLQAGWPSDATLAIA